MLTILIRYNNRYNHKEKSYVQWIHSDMDTVKPRATSVATGAIEKS